MSEPSYGVFRRVRCVANRKPLGVIVQLQTVGRKHFLAVWLIHLCGLVLLLTENTINNTFCLSLMDAVIF